MEYVFQTTKVSKDAYPDSRQSYKVLMFWNHSRIRFNEQGMENFNILSAEKRAHRPNLKGIESTGHFCAITLDLENIVSASLYSIKTNYAVQAS